MNRHIKTVAFAAIILISFLLRFCSRNDASLTQDEAWEYYNSKSGAAGLFYELRTDVHPAFMFAYRAWLAFGDAESHIRCFPVFAGTISVILAYSIGASLNGAGLGLLAAVIFGLAPVNIYFSQDARMYSFLMMLSLFSIYFFIRLVKNYSKTSLAGYLLFSALSVYTHPFAVMVIVGQSIFLMLERILEGRSSVPLRKWGGIQLALAAILLPFLLVVLFQFEKGFGSWIYLATYSKASLKAAFDMFVNFNSFYHRPLLESAGGAVERLFYYFQFVFPAAAITGIFVASLTGISKPGYLFALVSILPVFILYAVSTFQKPVFVFRYLYVFWSGYFFLMCLGIFRIKSRTLVGVIISSMVLYLLSLDLAFNNHSQRDKWREFVTQAVEESKPGDVLLIIHDGSADPVNFYLARQKKQAELPVKVIPFCPNDAFNADTPPGEIEKRLSEAISPLIRGQGRVWLIHNWSSDPRDHIINYFKNFSGNPVSIFYTDPCLNLFVLP